MDEFPAMTFYTDAYLADTGHLTTTEHGAYMLLLISMWRAGGTLPDDDKTLARVARMTMSQWRRAKPALWRFMEVGKGYITQHKLLQTIDAVRQLSQSRRDSARRRWLKHKGLPSALASAEHQQNDAIQNQRSTYLEGSALSRRSTHPRKEFEPGPKVAPIVPSAALLASKLLKKPDVEHCGADELEIPEFLKVENQAWRREKRT